MASILIVGDSWGVPNYYGPPGVPKTHHTEFLLKAMGHTVYNCSLNGSSNLTSLQKAKSFVASHAEPIEYLLWFHTELFRESNLVDYTSGIEENLHTIADIVYREYASFINQHKLKLCAIGGQANLLPELFNYMDPIFHIMDWRQDILGMDLPNGLHLIARNYDWIPKLAKDTQTKIELLTNQKIILDAMEYSTDFPDNCHPGTLPHQNLANKLNFLFNNMQP